LVVEDTPENLADAIIRLVDDATLREKIGLAARKRMSEDFNLTIQLTNMEEVYRRLQEFRT